VNGDPLATTDSQGNYVITDLDFSDDSVPGTFTIRPMAVPGYTVENQDEAIQATFTNSTYAPYTAYTGYNFEMQPTLTQLTGTAIGTAGSYDNQGNTAAKAFDGNLSTFFDAPSASGNWVGLDLSSAQVVTQVKYAPRTGWTGRMVGGEIQASNTANFSSGVVTLYTINSTPTAGVLTTVSLSNTTAYRYYRYIGPANSYCDIAELEFDG
jgi:F5/8 type C domain